MVTKKNGCDVLLLRQYSAQIIDCQIIICGVLHYLYDGLNRRWW